MIKEVKYHSHKFPTPLNLEPHVVHLAHTASLHVRHSAVLYLHMYHIAASPRDTGMGDVTMCAVTTATASGYSAAPCFRHECALNVHCLLDVGAAGRDSALPKRVQPQLTVCTCLRPDRAILRWVPGRRRCGCSPRRPILGRYICSTIAVWLMNAKRLGLVE